MIVTVFDSLYSAKPSYHHHLQVLDRIKNGGPLNGIISEIRAEADKDSRNNLKKKLPIICFGGKFSERKKSALIEASGLLVLDFDSGDVAKLRKQFEAKPYTVAAFSGPSGAETSLKVLIRIPLVENDEEYKAYFGYIESRMIDLDKSGKDICRATFYSYDPETYINPNATEFSLPKGYIETMSNPQARLASICDKVLTSPKGQSHQDLLAAAYTAGGLVSSGLIPESVAIRALEDAADTRRPKEFKDSRDAIKTALDAGKAKPLYDDEGIGREVQRFVRPKRVVQGNSLIVTREKIEETSTLYNEDKLSKARSLGIPYLDDYLVFRDNAFYMIVGGKGAGKSSTLMYLFTLDAFVHGKKTLMILMENEAWEMEQECVSFLTGCGAKWLYSSNRARYDKAADFFHAHFSVMRTPPDFTMFDIFDAAGQINSQSNYDRLFVDPIFKVAGTSEYSDNKRIAAHAQPFAQEVMSLWVSMHPTGSAQRNGGQPTDLQAEYGGLYSNAADITMTLARDYKSKEEGIRNTANLTIDKVRSKKISGGSETFKDYPIKFEYKWKKNGYDIWIPRIDNPDHYERVENVFSHLIPHKS